MDRPIVSPLKPILAQNPQQLALLCTTHKKQRVCAKFFCPNFLPFLRRFGQKVECWVCRNEWASHFRVTCFWSLIVSKKIYEVNLIEIINQKGKDWRISLITHFCSMQLICFISLGIIYERIFNRNFKIL